MFSASFSREAYSAGGLVTVLLRGRGISNDTVVIAQAHGHLCADTRWLRFSGRMSDVFLNTAAYPLDQRVQNPKPSPPFPQSAPCIFSTPREVVSTTFLEEEGGVYLQFDLPRDVLPTFKGLSISIAYNIAIMIQSPSKFDTIYFPFTVAGHGTPNSPHMVKTSSLSVFAASSLPKDNYFVPPVTMPSPEATPSTQDAAVAGEDRIRDQGEGGGVRDAVYNISDKALICSVSLVRTGPRPGFLSAGETLCLHLDFEAAGQPCRAVRARLVQCERRPDASRVQDREICAATRCTQDAASVYLNLSLPIGIPCTFQCPLAEVKYRLDMDFFLGGAGSDALLEPLQWTIPIDVFPPPSYTNSVSETNLCLEPAVRLVHAI